MDRRVLLILGVGIIMCACASMKRRPNSDGGAGMTGEAGRNGEAGFTVQSNGCEDYVRQSVRGITKYSDAQSWISIAAYVCPESFKVSPDVLVAADSWIDKEMEGFEKSGFAKGAGPIGASKSLADLSKKVNALGEDLKQIEATESLDLGCRDGEDVDLEAMVKRIQVCFKIQRKSIESDGKISLALHSEVKGYKSDGTLSNSVLSSNSYDLTRAPVVCANGVPPFSLIEHSQAGEESFVHTVASTCEGFQDTLFYPNREVGDQAYSHSYKYIAN